MYKKLNWNKGKKEENKKVKNATKVEYDGIKFKSKLERYFHQQANEVHKLGFEYESLKTILHEGVRLEGYLYQPNKLGKMTLDTTKLMDIKYTPDWHRYFENSLGRGLIVVECKGIKTSTYQIKKKMFLSIMNKKYGQNLYFFEPHNHSQIQWVIETIKNEVLNGTTTK
jgi:hypothetical protein